MVWFSLITPHVYEERMGVKKRTDRSVRLVFVSDTKSKSRLPWPVFGVKFFCKNVRRNSKNLENWPCPNHKNDFDFLQINSNLKRTSHFFRLVQHRTSQAGLSSQTFETNFDEKFFRNFCSRNPFRRSNVVGRIDGLDPANENPNLRNSRLARSGSNVSRSDWTNRVLRTMNWSQLSSFILFTYNFT